MSEDIHSLDEWCTSSSGSSFSSTDIMTPPSISQSSTRRPSVASLSRAYNTAESSSVSSRRSTAPTTPSHDRPYSSIDPILPYDPYLATVPMTDSTFFGAYANVNTVNDTFTQANTVNGGSVKSLANWDPADFSADILPTHPRSFRALPNESFVYPPDNYAVGLDPNFVSSDLSIDRSDTAYDMLDLSIDLDRQMLPQTVVPSHAFSRPRTPRAKLGDPFQSSVKMEPYSADKIIESYSPMTNPSLHQHINLPKLCRGTAVKIEPSDSSQRGQSSRAKKIKKGVKDEDRCMVEGIEVVEKHVEPMEKKHKCEMGKCRGKNVAFNRIEHLKRHQKTLIHTGKTPFACKVIGCSKKFNRNDNLRQHYNTHLPPDLQGKHSKRSRNKLVEEGEAIKEGIVPSVTRHGRDTTGKAARKARHRSMD